jgi:hypothetical protein
LEIVYISRIRVMAYMKVPGVWDRERRVTSDDAVQVIVKSQSCLLKGYGGTEHCDFRAFPLTPDQAIRLDQHPPDAAKLSSIIDNHRVIKFIDEVCPHGATFSGHSLDPDKRSDAIYLYDQCVMWPLPLTRPRYVVLERQVAVRCKGGLEENSWLFNVAFNEDWD